MSVNLAMQKATFGPLPLQHRKRDGLDGPVEHPPFQMTKWKIIFTMPNIVWELNPGRAGENRALYHSATSPAAVVDHEWYWVVDWQAACSISWSPFPVPLQHSAAWKGSLPVNNSIPLMSNHSCRGCSAVVKRLTFTGVIRVQFPNHATHYFPFWKFLINLVQASLQKPKFTRIAKK